MSEEFQQKFEEIFAEVIDTEQGKVELVHDPDVVQVPIADGVSMHYSFHFAILYYKSGQKQYLAFRFMPSEDLISLQECKSWVFGVKRLYQNVHVCLVTDKGFCYEALEYVKRNSFDLDKRLILAKFCGDDKHSLVLNRLWTDCADPRGRTGVLTSEKPCSGAVLYMSKESYNTIGILRELGIHIKPEFEFKCPYVGDLKIEEKTLEILNTIQLKEEDLRKEPDFLYRIARQAQIEVKLTEMGDEFFGEYSYADKTIYLNSRQRFYGANERERFTLAHELGHHFLHRRILEQYNFHAADDQDSIQLVGAANNHIRYFENQANKFASYLLMPQKMFTNYAKEVMTSLDIRRGFVHDDNQYSLSEGAFNHRTALTFVNRMAEHFYVSKEAARYRLKDLNLLREQSSIEPIKQYL